MTATHPPDLALPSNALGGSGRHLSRPSRNFRTIPRRLRGLEKKRSTLTALQKRRNGPSSRRRADANSGRSQFGASPPSREVSRDSCRRRRDIMGTPKATTAPIATSYARKTPTPREIVSEHARHLAEESRNTCRRRREIMGMPKLRQLRLRHRTWRGRQLRRGSFRNTPAISRKNPGTPASDAGTSWGRQGNGSAD